MDANKPDLEKHKESYVEIKTVPKEEVLSLFSEGPDWLLQLIPGLTFEVENKCLWITGVHTLARKHIMEMQEHLITSLHQKGFIVTRIAFNRSHMATTYEKPDTYKSFESIDEKPLKTIYGHTRHRIYKRLLNTAINGRLCDEVIHAIEQGCFSHHPMLMGINIALKLIRENRWCTPSGYPQPGSKI